MQNVLLSHFKVLAQNFPGGTEEKHKILSQDSRSPLRNLNQGPPEHEMGVLAT